MIQLDKAQRILVIKIRYIGDVLLVTPVLESLKQAFPQVSASMLVNAGTEGVLANNPFLEEVFLVPEGKSWGRHIALIHTLRSRKFDMILDLTDGDRAAVVGFLSGAKYRVGYNSEQRWRGTLYHRIVQGDRHEMHAVDYHLRALEAVGCKIDCRNPRIYPSKQDHAAADQLLKERGISPDKPWIALHPGARHWFKAWPEENFIELAGRLHAEHHLSILVVGGPKETEMADCIVKACGPWADTVAGRTTLLQLGALLGRASFFVGNDAGPMHIAASVGTPVLALFGPTPPAVWGPLGEGHRVIWKKIDCTDCWRDGCQRGELNCMRQIGVDEVYEAARDVLNA